MASPVTPKASTPMAKTAASGPARVSTPQGKNSSPAGVARSTPAKPATGQSTSGRSAAGQSGTGKTLASSSSSPSPGQSGVSRGSNLHASPGKLGLGQSSPRKSVFGKSGTLKLSQSPSKSFFGKLPSGKSPGSGSGQFDLPLALRKKRRPNAGMKREVPTFDEKSPTVMTKSPKDGKAPQKRKLSQSSPNGSKMAVKNKADYVPPSSKKRKISRSNRDQDSRNDFYCWVCHKEGSVICCELCPRVYHGRCARLDVDPQGDWFCPECERATTAECVDSQSAAMSSLTLDQLAKLLMYALKRMRHSGAEPFMKPVSLQHNPGYDEFVFNPMDLSTLEKNIKKRMYGSTEAFLLDAKWILHNCIVFNGSHHKLTNSARMIIKICEYEMKEIEVCPDCYLSASIKRDKWFCEVCRNPHQLVWARLQGFPFWPSKVIREKDGMLDVRFFGQHDRAWVPVNSCFMFSGEIPIPSKKKTSGLTTSILEMELHIQNLQKVFGKHCFCYAPKRTPYGTFDCLRITPKDKERWFEDRAGNGLLLNGISGTPPPKEEASAVKIKTEPIDKQFDEAERRTPPETRPSERLPAESSKPQESKPGPEKGLKEAEESGVRPSTKDSQVTIGGSVRRQVFTITRKRPIEPDKADPKQAAEAPSAAGSDDSNSSSPSKAPVGVFEVSDESLDVDPTAEAQSPAVQLLGKGHVPAKSFERSLTMRLEKLSPTVLAKKGKPVPSKDEAGGETKDLRQGESTEADLQEGSAVKDPQEKPSAEKSRASNGSDSRDEQTKAETTDEGDSDKLRKADAPEADKSDKQEAEGKIPDEQPSSSGPPKEDTPGAAQSLPPAKDKFHIKLGKTIETMKASLGIQRLRSEEKETSDSESSAAECDSDSSDAEHSDDSDMEGDDDDDRGGIIVKKGTRDLMTEDMEVKTIKGDAAEPPRRDPEASGSQTDASADAKSSSQEDLEDSPGRRAPAKARLDSEIDLQMSCHSEMSDSDEDELVIDESRTPEMPATSKAAESSSDAAKSSAASSSVCRPREPSAVEADDVILVSDPFEMQDSSRTDPAETKQPEESPPDAEEKPPATATAQEKLPESDDKQSDQKEEPVSKTSEPEKPPLILTSTTAIKSAPPKELETKVTEEAAKSAAPVPKVVASSPAPPQNAEPPQSSSVKLPESLPSSEPLPAPVPTQLTATVAEVPVVTPDTATASKEDPKDVSKTGSGTEEMEVDESQPSPECEMPKRSLYKKYMDKMSSTLEGVLDEFREDVTAGRLLEEAKTSIKELKQQVQEMTWQRKQEQVEFKQIMDLAVAEMKECMEAESKVALVNLRSQLEVEKQEEIRRTKTKQWCASCGKDAVFFCCWNTSYCDYPCQQSHWSQHRNSCQQRSLGNTVVQVQQIPNKAQQISVSSTIPTPTTTDIVRIISPMGKSAAEQLRLISNQQVKKSGPTMEVPVQLHAGSPSGLQQAIHAVPPPRPPLPGPRPVLQQQPQAPRNLQMQAQPRAASAAGGAQPMQTLIQYVQAPRMSAPLPVRQLVPTRPFVVSGRVVNNPGSMRMVRP